MFKLVRKFLMILVITICIPVLLWGSGFVMFTAAIYYMTEPQTTEKVDGAIVLTGGSNRVSKGFDLLAEKRITSLLISGVHKDVEIRDIMALWGQKDNVPPCCITLGREAGNTIGNATEAKKWIEHEQLKKVYLITANYHMPRALLEFNHQIPDVKLIPFPVQPENFDPKQDIFWRTDFVEYHKMLLTIYRILVYPDETNALPESLNDALRK
ncbi:MAG: hypothetical protein A3J37_03400 [Alphaproteobacteria bacterium RIFCSPHIGHO2_12_FULL_45_9]|nr:MAG: hypothetical protein A3B66_01010 [Alphaproteobacteria bacterium RIFCSPHIGHO2_02_FULL_46_13]OFW98481.1 MAG: hypothetical protein A3J37_03400 [Alphaproteobacteria bacterium RIFCSPHIGHO2_12_FULL_45_9]